MGNLSSPILLKSEPRFGFDLFTSASMLTKFSRAKFLTEDERREVKTRLHHDHTGLAEEYHFKYVIAAFKDWKIYVQMLIIFGVL